MASSKPFPVAVRPQASPIPSSEARVRRLNKVYLATAAKSFVLIPVFPLAGYCLLDQTGFTHWLITLGLVPEAVLGEGFGHVGFCFSIHYLFTGLRALSKALGLLFR